MAMPAGETFEEVKRGEVAVTYPPATVAYTEKGNVRTYHYVIDEAVIAYSNNDLPNSEETVDLLFETMTNIADIEIAQPWWFKRPDSDGLFIVSKKANGFFGFGANSEAFRKEYGIKETDKVIPVEVEVKMVSGEGDTAPEKYFSSYSAITVTYKQNDELKKAEMVLKPHYATKIEELPPIAHFAWNSPEYATIKLGLAGNGVTYWDVETNAPKQVEAPDPKEYFLAGVARILLTLSNAKEVQGLAERIKNIGKEEREDKKRRIKELLTEINVFMLENNL